MHCPHCRHELSVRTEYLGHRVRCRYCDAVFLVQLDVTDDPASGEFPVVPSGEFPAVQDEPVGAVRVAVSAATSRWA